jgi:UDP-N-acetylmuramyl pentapeptide phosphotransferase/UDP-N-acetylglucosamine-1-phosphate transferase
MHFALKRKLLDIPNERSSHFLPTPKGGGVAIIVSWYLGISILYFLNFIPENLFYSLLSGLLLAIISFIDDIVDLKPYIRLIAQVITASIALAFLDGLASIVIYKFEISFRIFLLPFTVVGMVWFINLYNFLDGIDGYASLEAITIAFAVFIFTGNIVCLIFMVCVLGFLSWNWPKARIFMGDVGSTQLGFILIVLGIYFHNQGELSIIHWLMLSSLFWFDATITLFRRWKNKEKLSLAHRKHVYQRAVQSGLSHQKTVLISLVFNILILGLVFLSRSFLSLTLPLFFINLIILYGLTRFIDKKVPFK